MSQPNSTIATHLYVNAVLIIVLIISFSFGTSRIHAAVDMTGWTLQDPYSNWSYTNPDNFTGRMDETGGDPYGSPAWVVSDFVLSETATFTLTLEVESGTLDDDPIGFAFNWQDANHFYLVDWKKQAQTFNWGDPVAINDDYAEQGLKLKLIDGSYTRDGLWGGQDGLGVSTLAGPASGSWNTYTVYTFDVTLSPGRMIVELNDALLFDVTDTTFAGGRIALYGFSQDNLIFTVPEAAAGLIGDLNGDGFVCLDDLDIILGNWNQNVPPANPLADPSGDGYVGLDDLDIVLGNWNAGTPPSALTIPEPAWLILLGLPLLAVLTRR